MNNLPTLLNGGGLVLGAIILGVALYALLTRAMEALDGDEGEE